MNEVNFEKRSAVGRQGMCRGASAVGRQGMCSGAVSGGQAGMSWLAVAGWAGRAGTGLLLKPAQVLAWQRRHTQPKVLACQRCQPHTATQPPARPGWGTHMSFCYNTHTRSQPTHLDSLDGVRARRRLARKHHAVGAVQHGVGHIGRLGTGGPRVLGHRLQHLRSGAGDWHA